MDLPRAALNSDERSLPLAHLLDRIPVCPGDGVASNRVDREATSKKAAA